MLDGTKILKEAWGENTLIPLYDNEDSVCGIVYNDVPYFFLKNLKGDKMKQKRHRLKSVPFTYKRLKWSKRNELKSDL